MRSPIRQAAVTIAASVASGAVAFAAAGDGFVAVAGVTCITFVMAFLSYFAAGGEA
jgi:hypothetical protein